MNWEKIRSVIWLLWLKFIHAELFQTIGWIMIIIAIGYFFFTDSNAVLVTMVIGWILIALGRFLAAIEKVASAYSLQSSMDKMLEGIDKLSAFAKSKPIFTGGGVMANAALSEIARRKSLGLVWLVWSNEHNAWWAPEERGYTQDMDLAGRYTEERADEICATAAIGGPVNGLPAEVKMRDPLTITGDE